MFATFGGEYFTQYLGKFLIQTFGFSWAASVVSAQNLKKNPNVQALSAIIFWNNVKQNYLKTFDSGWTAPPLLDNVQMKEAFCMSSLNPEVIISALGFMPHHMGSGNKDIVQV